MKKNINATSVTDAVYYYNTKKALNVLAEWQNKKTFYGKQVFTVR